MRINPHNLLARGYVLSLQSRGYNELTPRKAAALTQYAELAGMTPETI
jgi:hypothetical protein